MKRLSLLVKNGIDDLTLKRYHWVHKGLARHALAKIEKTKGKADPKVLALCDAYAGDVLGWRGYAPWLKVYAAFNTSFKEGWIPDNYYGSVVVPKIQGAYGKVSNLKSFSNKLFNTQSFPDIAYGSNGRWVSPNGEFVADGDVPKLIFKEHTRVLFKPDNSMQGLGIRLLDKKSFRPQDLKNLGNGVFQYYIDQHPFYSSFTPNAVATLRITTTTDELGKSAVKATYLRLGRNTDAFVKSASQIKVPVNINNGNLSSLGYLEDWKPIKCHPDTKVVFEGSTIPFFGKAVQLCLQLHENYPQVRGIGWDVTLDSLGEVKILEWNGYHNDIKFSEITDGPCFAGLGWEHLWKETK